MKPSNQNQRVPDRDYLALAEFRYQIRRYIRFSEEAARQAGVEPQHHQLMLAIKGKRNDEIPSIAYLAERLQLQHHSTVELIDRLVKKGLIARRPSDTDRRQVCIDLTPRGEQILGQLTLHMRTEMHSAAPALVATLRKLAVPRKRAARAGRAKSQESASARSTK